MNRLHEQLLEGGNGLTLQNLINRAATHEVVGQRSKEMSNVAAISRVGCEGASDYSSNKRTKIRPMYSQMNSAGKYTRFGKACHQCEGRNHYCRCCREANKGKNRHGNSESEVVARSSPGEETVGNDKP